MELASPAVGSATVCPTTGLALFRSHGQNVWRVQKSSYGPLNPPARSAGTDRGNWGRWDIPAGLTIYAGISPLGSYMETLAWAEPADLGTRGAIFTDDGPDSTPLITDIAQDWADANHMPPKSLAAGWRHDRRLYNLTLPSSGWFVDLRHSDTIAALNRSAQLNSSVAPQTAGRQLTLGDLLGHDRELTTRVAEWLYQQVLHDGHLPHGVIYSSKWGDDLPCFAIWLRKLTDGAGEDSEPTHRAHPPDGKPIEADDPDLRKAAAKLNITIH